MAQRRLTVVEGAAPPALELPATGTTVNGRPHAPSAVPRPLLSVSGVVKRWRALPEPVLRGVDLVLEPGSAVHLAGRNGAGKTTLLRVIAGLIKPDWGSLSIAGLDPERQRVDYQRRLGFLPAGDRGLYARLSVARHLDLWARVSYVEGSRRRAVVARALDRFALGDLAGRRVDRLSMGQRQRLRLAGLLLHSPALLLLDEPCSSLDEEAVELMSEALGEQLECGGAVLWCSPSGEGPARLPLDRALVLEDGRLEAR
jgi:ABC-type multidrug transport system ATPase subunit